MVSFKELTVVAAIAGAAFALPPAAEDSGLVERRWWGGYRHWQHSETENIVWVTVTATAEGGSVPTATAAATAVSSSAWVFAAAPESEAASAPASTVAAAAATATAGSSGETGYMAIVSKWRAAGGLPALTQDSTLEANALKTTTDSGGQLKHELNPGTLAQVLAPGNADNFESVYVGGWLCEIPTLPGLNGICATEAQGWDHSSGETGHADILTSTSYTKIGCALADGIWGCDLA